MTNYAGVTASGRRIYIRDPDRSLAFAILADTHRDGRLRIVARVEDGQYPAIRCARGAVHEGPCEWTERVTMSSREYAESRVHWWTHVTRTAAELVKLQPTKGHRRTIADRGGSDGSG